MFSSVLITGSSGRANLQVDGNITGSVIVWGCRVISTATPSVNSNTWTALTFNSELADTDNCWSSSYNTRLYARRAGYYHIEGSAYLNTADANVWSYLIGIRINGSSFVAIDRKPNVKSDEMGGPICVDMLWMNANDYAEIMVYQTRDLPRPTWPRIPTTSTGNQGLFDFPAGNSVRAFGGNMQTTLQTLLDAQPAIQHLLEQKLPVKAAYRLQKALRKILTEIRDFEMVRAKMIHEYAGVAEDQPAKVPEEKIGDFTREIGVLLQEEVELEGVVKVKLEELEGCTLSVADVMGLEFLIEEE